MDDGVLDDVIVSIEDKRKYFLNNMDLVLELAQSEVTKSDIVALAYRKNQLEIFEGLLIDDSFFEAKQVEWGKKGKEAVWQYFFEQNPWIFGYGLNYIFASNLDEKKLEQITTGFAVNQRGKRVDALLKTKGYISSLCFVEIKTHKTPLIFHGKAYRPSCWRVSDELAGSVAQSQITVQKAIETIRTKLELQNEDGDPTGESAYLYQPKSFVVVGNLSEFITDYGVNEDKHCAFELFRRNMVNPEVLTFDELFERARFIVHHAEEATEARKKINL